MFSQLFFRSDALARQLSAPLVYERGQYLTHCAAQGMSKSTLSGKARLLISITECLRLADRPYDTISLPEIKIAATRWSRHNRRSLKAGRAKHSQRQFIAEASRGLIFLNCLHTPPKAERACDEMLAEFRSFIGTTAVCPRSQLNTDAEPYGRSLRDCSGTHLLRAGVDINTIRAWLGHVSLNTTNIYAEVDLEMKAKALATCESGQGDVVGVAAIPRTQN